MTIDIEKMKAAALAAKRDDCVMSMSPMRVLALIQRLETAEKQRDELVKAAEAIEIDSDECLDFDECTAMLVPIDTYHKMVEALASVKEKK